MANNIVIPINKTVDISQGTLITTLGLQNTNDQLIQGQSYANVLNVSVNNNGVPVELSGECMGYFVRQQDGSTVQVAGTISGNMASVEFPSFVYAYTGRLTITLSVGGTDLVQIATTVRLGSTFVVVDPGNVLPNLDEIQQIMLDVENALNQLSGALTASQQATQAANTAAGTANTAATAANKAATTANTAAAALNGLTATANTLEPTQPATATAQLVDGAWKITMGVPQGIQGIQGVRGITAFQGSAITGTSTTPTAYATGIASALAGDLYLYTGTDNANIGNVYTCTQGGDASTALWAYATNWRGAPGSGAVSTVNNFQPDQEGNVNLPGQIYPCTASALESLSTSDLVGIYNQGYRAVQATNDETVVTLGLAADGSLSWQGCNQPRKNLLDNPDFAIAQAGYGGTHGAQVYAADRWKGSGTGATFVAGSGGGLSITCGTGAAGCSQVVAEPPAVGEYFSFVVVVGGVPLIASGTWTGTAQDATATSGTLTATVTAGSVQISVASGSATVNYCMLLIGSYTPKTLPAWEKPDNALEMQNCQQIFEVCSKNVLLVCVSVSTSIAALRIFIPYATTKLAGVTPTIVAPSTISLYFMNRSAITLYNIPTSEFTAYADEHGSTGYIAVPVNTIQQGDILSLYGGQFQVSRDL